MTARPLDYRVAARRRIRRPSTPAAALVSGFGILVVIGTVLLLLPIANEPGVTTDLVTALFTSTSAVCVNGLVVDTATHWSPFGEAVIIALVQVGGFGFMTGSTLLLLMLVRRRTGLRDRILVQESTGAIELGSVLAIVRRVGLFTLVAEAVGAAVLFTAFLAGGLDAGRAAWFGLFHSVTRSTTPASISWAASRASPPSRPTRSSS